MSTLPTGLRNPRMQAVAVNTPPPEAEVGNTAPQTRTSQHANGLLGRISESYRANVAPIYTGQSSANPVTRYQNFAEGLRTRDGASNEEISRNAGNLSRAQEDLFQSVYAPVQQELIDSLDDTTLIDQAKETAGGEFAGSQARSERERTRYGLTRTGAEEREEGFRRNLDEARNYDDSVNSARDNQNNRRIMLRDALIDIGRGVEDSASQGLQTGGNNASTRDASNQVNAANESAARRQQNTSLAGTAMMLAVMAM